MAENLLIVESPSKAKTIEGYLGPNFHVISSAGHIRKDTKVDPAHDFAVTYEIDPGHKKIVSELKREIKKAKTIWLATDDDREGESIAWHLIDVFKLPLDTNRILFHEITKPALSAAISDPHTIDMNMVNSQQARQTLDMLVGYDLSGVVRKKVPGAASAGRVQSPALRLVVEKEREIEKFTSKSTFKITGEFEKDDSTFLATLDKIVPTSEEEAADILEHLKDNIYIIDQIEQKEGKRTNPTPLTTAAMLVEANSRLGYSTNTTMRAAQALYQAGLITYHRTDSLNFSSQFLAAAADYIEKTYGKPYAQVRHFKTKDASAQEAHEAIRPTDITKEVAGKNDFEKRLYNLIRTRTLATQMANAKVMKTTVTIKPKSEAKKINFVAKGEIITFDGFLRVYGNAKDTTLPNLKKGDEVSANYIKARQTFAKPPARYTEGSLVDKLKELGIGRPSTYSSIMSAIQTRGYVIKGESEGEPRDVIELCLTYDDTSGASTNTKTVQRQVVQEKSGSTKGRLLPTPIGELISDFLLDHFNQVVDYGFTAEVEAKLDLIAEAKLQRVKMLRDFYTPFSKLIADSEGIERYNNSTTLGIDPKTQKPIYAKIGKNGGFIQLGDNEKETGEKPRFAPLPDGKTVKTVTFEEALSQLALPALPRSLGKAKDGTELIAAAGPFGPYLKAGKYNIPLKGHDPYTIPLSDAEPLYDAKLASIIADWDDIMIINGAYGPYIKGPGRRNNLKIPKDQDPHKITKEQAIELLNNKPKVTRRAPRRRKQKS